jgi:hypothetical protein
VQNKGMWNRKGIRSQKVRSIYVVNVRSSPPSANTCRARRRRRPKSVSDDHARRSVESVKIVRWEFGKERKGEEDEEE